MSGIVDGGIAVVTGGATGIGLALARQLAGRGMTVVVVSTNKERLDLAVQSLRAEGGKAHNMVCDLIDREAVRQVADAVRAQFGPVDLLVANAGATTTGRFIDHGDGDWDWSIDLNLRAATNCIQAFYPAMAQRGSGHIMLTGSQTAYAPDWVLSHGPYVAAKAAVHALAFALRDEAAALGVGISLLIPAGTDTEVLLGQRSRAPHYGKPVEGNLHVRDGVPAVDPARGWLSADEVARRAIAGLDAGRFVIPTHPVMRAVVKDYFDRILDAYDWSASQFEPDAD